MNKKVIWAGVFTITIVIMLQLSINPSQTGYFVAGDERPTSLTVDYADQEVKAFYLYSSRMIRGAECSISFNDQELIMHEKIGYYSYPLPNRRYEVSVNCYKQGYSPAQKTVNTL